ncbi:hypothetical protein EDD86DRAFT_274903 [Gorgonomyces haynaldii]|nr:hypothetical protein EDD86DRAFT_274903 [Gorgonomyces haynaldii]
MSQTTAIVPLLTAVGTNLAISAGLFLAFSVIRSRNKIVYEPRIKFSDTKKQPPKLPDDVLSWVTVMTYNDLEQAPKIGVDAVIFLRIARFLAHYFSILAVIAVPHMLINAFATKGQSGEFLPSISAANIEPNSQWWWLPAILSYVYACIFYYMMWNLWADYAQLRREYFATDEYLHNPKNRTVLVTEIPEELHNREKLKEFVMEYQEFVPQSVLLGRDFVDLPDLVKEHEKITLKMEKILMRYLRDPYNLPERPTHRENAALGVFGGELVDSISFYGKKLHELEAKIYQIRTRPNDSFKANNSAFIQFDKIIGAHQTAKKLSSNLLDKTKQMAKTGMLQPPSFKLSPEFDDIIWDNISVDAVQKWPRRLISIGLTVALFFAYTFVIMPFIYSLSNISNWSRIPGLQEKLDHYPVLTVFIQSYLAPILTIVVNIIIPVLFRFLSRLQGVVSKSGVERSTLNKFFAFLVYQFIAYLLNTVLESYLKSLFLPNDKKEEDFFKVLGKKFSETAGFYVSLTATMYSAQALEIIQAAPFVMTFIRRRFLKSTPREQFKLNEPPRLDYMATYGSLLFTFFNTLAYSLTAPFIVLFAALLFWIYFLVMKYQLYYVYETEQEEGGRWLGHVFFLMCLSVAGFQFATFGMIVVNCAFRSFNNGKTQSLLTALGMLLTGFFWFFIRNYVAPKADFVSKHQEDVAFADVDEPSHPADQLEKRVFNPYLVKPLPKIWVSPQQQAQLQQLYKPQYADLIDFVRRTQPHLLPQAQQIQQEQKEQVRTLLRRQTKTQPRFLEDETLMSADHADVPPEVEELHELMDIYDK